MRYRDVMYAHNSLYSDNYEHVQLIHVMYTNIAM